MLKEFLGMITRDPSESQVGGQFSLNKIHSFLLSELRTFIKRKVRKESAASLLTGFLFSSAFLPGILSRCCLLRGDLFPAAYRHTVLEQSTIVTLEGSDWTSECVVTMLCLFVYL
ncbi:hypothetical protein AVEN_52727-1 [Araneus ventricosus]|uniref:Uncharacterized protein n=1 Tax=Araneus ventricosus TaxID=182803 RepID=A0A4Y2IHV8_ARAVE|nr:hypothetical protein AVEN_52727-1 [Araneus ventricosus]